MKEPKTEQGTTLFDEGPDYSESSFNSGSNPSSRQKHRKSRSASRQPAIPLELLSRLKKALKVQLTECEFCSRSEAVCAVLMEHYIPGFTLTRGATFQIPINVDRFGNQQCVDFAVENILFEYHPVRFWRKKSRFGDFEDKEEYKTYSRVFRTLRAESREFFHSIMRQKLVENYTRKRRALLDRSKTLRHTELVVADSPGDFYHKIIRRFGNQYPSQNIFEEIFEALWKKKGNSRTE